MTLQPSSLAPPPVKAVKRRTGGGKVARQDAITGLGYRAKMSEEEVQKCVFQHLTSHGVQGLTAFHPKNGGSHQASAAQRVKNAQQGVLSGIPDVIIAHGGKGYALELKALGGPISVTQLDVLDQLRRAGWITGIAFGIDEALSWLTRHKLLRGKV